MSGELSSKFRHTRGVEEKKGKKIVRDCVHAIASGSHSNEFKNGGHDRQAISESVKRNSWGMLERTVSSLASLTIVLAKNLEIRIVLFYFSCRYLLPQSITLVN